MLIVINLIVNFHQSTY